MIKFALAALLILVFLLPAVSPADAVTVDTLATLCGYQSVPLASVTVVDHVSRATPYTVTDTKDLETVLGYTVNQIPPTWTWVERIRFNPSGYEADVFVGNAALPYRLQCRATGVVARTDAAFFDCEIMGIGC